MRLQDCEWGGARSRCTPSAPQASSQAEVIEQGKSRVKDLDASVRLLRAIRLPDLALHVPRPPAC